MSKGWGSAFAGVASLVIVLAWVWPDLRNKTAAQEVDKTVAMAVDWEDIVAYSVDVVRIPASTVVMASSADPAAEETVRAAGKRVVWRIDDSIRPDPWISRLKDGDGVFVVGAHALEHPRLLRELPETLRAKNGYLMLLEFAPRALVPGLASRIPERLVKGHVLPTREIVNLNERRWLARLSRAVEERWARFLIVRFAPAMSIEENLTFQEKIVENLKKNGFEIGAPAVFKPWKTRGAAGLRLKAALLISIVVPLVALYWAMRSRWPAAVVFVAICAFSVLAGVVIHGLGSTPSSVLGLAQMRGVKLQLLLPLLLGAALLLSPEQAKRLMDVNLKVKHLLFAGVFVGLLGGVYLMRSGNFPVLPVSDGERYFRDWLDSVLVARPRFKEFLVGHPLLLIGLALKKKNGEFETVARGCLLAGLIGQISIMNTFTHFHSPLQVGLIRTLNGFWVGALVALPSLLLLHSRRAAES